MINTKIIEIDPRELKLLKMNARFMRMRSSSAW